MEKTQSRQKQKNRAGYSGLLLLVCSLVFVNCSKKRDDRILPTDQGRYLDISSQNLISSGELASEDSSQFNQGTGAASEAIRNGEIAPEDRLTYNWMYQQSPKLAGKPSAFLRTTHYLKTTGPLVENIGYTNAEQATIYEDANEYDINDYLFVDFQTNSPYLDGVNIRAKEYSEYEIRYGYTEKYFNIYKVASPDLIPFLERAYAMPLADGRLMVPVAAYPVSYMQQVYSEDQFGNRTNVVNYKPVRRFSDATHLEIDFSNLVTFDPIIRQNIIPANYFKENEEWFYSSTVVEAEMDSGEIIGRDASTDFALRGVSRVKVMRDEQFLRFVNINIAEELEGSDVNLVETLKILVDWIDLRRTRDGSDAGYTTELLVEGNNSRRWQNRAFIQLNLQEVSSAISDFGSNARIASSTLEDLKIGKDFISFLLTYYRTEMIEGRNHRNKIKVRYVLKRASTPKKPRVYPLTDRRTFGFFSTIRDYIPSDFRNQRQEDIEQKVYLNRFLPQQNEQGEKVIEFYFTNHSTTDPLFRQVAQESIDAWNVAFAEAAQQTGKKPIKIELNTSKEVDLGDIRYNAINMIDIPDSGRILGYGPSIVDTKSGEIIAATSNVYINPFRLSAYAFLRNYVKAQIGVLDEKYLLNLPNVASNPNSFNVLSMEQKALAKTRLQQVLDTGVLEQRNSQLQQRGLSTAKLKSDIQRMLSHELKNIPHYTDFRQQQKEQLLRHSHQQLQHDHQASYSLHWEDTIKIVRQECPNIEKYIQEVSQINSEDPQVFHTADEIQEFDGCVRKIMASQIRSTTIHELGHNFGLRHNFAASYDAANFYGIQIDRDGKPRRDEKGDLVFDQQVLERKSNGLPVHVTSIMEYVPSNKRELQMAGSYDIATLRFGYYDAVKLKDGSIAPLDVDKSIQRNVGRDSIHPYAYCTDEDVFFAYDPTCQRHDFGTTPKEIVDNIVLQTDAHFATGYHRFDRPNINSVESILRGIMNLSRAYMPMRAYYVQWRFQLKNFLQKIIGANAELASPYLDRLTPQQYQQILQMMSQDPEYQKTFEEYYPAVQNIYAFLKKISFNSNRYCLLGGETVLAENKEIHGFVSIQNIIYRNTGTTITSCKDPIVAQFYGTEVEEVGHPLNDVLSSKEASDIVIDRGSMQITTNIEVIGTFWDKLFAYQTLIDRNVQSTETMVMTEESERLFPNFLDEPHFRADLTEATWTSIGQGKPTTTIGIDHLAGDRLVYKFEEDSELMNIFASFMRAGLMIPNASVQRYTTPFMALVTRDRRHLDVAAAYLEFDNTYIIATRNNTKAKELIDRYNFLQQLDQVHESFIDQDNQQAVHPDYQLLDQFIMQVGYQAPSLNQLTTMSAKEYADHYAPFVQGIQALQQSPATAQFVFMLFGQELQLIFFLNQPQAIEQFGDDLNLPLTKFLEEYELPFNVESFVHIGNAETRLNRLKERMQTIVPESLFFYKNKHELKKQMELIVQVLLTLSQGM